MNLSNAHFTVCEKKCSEVFQIKEKKKKSTYKIVAKNGLIKSACARVHMWVHVCVQCLQSWASPWGHNQAPGPAWLCSTGAVLRTTCPSITILVLCSHSPARTRAGDGRLNNTDNNYLSSGCLNPALLLCRWQQGGEGESKSSCAFLKSSWAGWQELHCFG